MDSKRQKQVAEVLRRYLGMLLTEEGSLIYGRDKLVTVTQVRMTPDLLLAKVYVSVYGSDNKQEVILQLEDNYPRIRQALGSRIAKNMRRVPELQFFLDDTVDEMYRVETLLENMDKPEQKNIL
ncbi:MAG: 30S ribosome-binding factor RbfA [Saprospiraceae bacterium]